jgi:hypothetical protein
MSQVNEFEALRARLLARSRSAANGAAFDPDAGHPDDFYATHSAAYRAALDGCDGCHGTDLLGGISAVSCYSTSRDGRSCQPGGPGGHPAGWRALHSADASKAATCAPCHDNKSNNLAPNCFDNSLCHGRSPAIPRLAVGPLRSDLSQASIAGCHQKSPGIPGCFNTLCHGDKSCTRGLAADAHRHGPDRPPSVQAATRRVPAPPPFQRHFAMVRR